MLHLCDIETSKVLQNASVLNIFTYKCASRRSGVQFFDIRTSKSGPSMLCFVHFELQMCFSLQRRAILPHLNFKKWSAPEVFCTFRLYILTCKCASRYSGVQFFDIRTSKVVRACCVLCILTSKCASRYSGVQFFISPRNSYLRTRRFTKPTFRPSRPTNH